MQASKGNHPMHTQRALCVLACLAAMSGCSSSSNKNGASMTGSGGSGASGSGGATGSGGSSAAATEKVTGTATFTQSGTSVNLMIDLKGCGDGEMHPVHIHQGTSCDTVATQMGHWDTPMGGAANSGRGEGIPAVMCTKGTGSGMHTRTGDNATQTWGVGASTTTH